MHVLIQEQIRAHPERVEQLIHTLSVSRQLERVGDLAVNVAEDVVYTVEGEIIRHRTASFG
jgi:phosphate transport system protein